MNDDNVPVPDEETEQSEAAREAERKRALARVFGDVLPDGSRDERPAAWGDPDNGGRDDDWFRREVPPHHG